MFRLFLVMGTGLIAAAAVTAATVGNATAATIRTLNTGHCLALEGGIDRPDGTAFVILPCDGNPAQRFTLPGDGSIRLGERCIDANITADGNPGEALAIQPCTNAASQRWELIGPGWIRGLNFYCMDVKGSGGEGTNVMVWRCHGGKNQRWSVE